MKRIISCLLVLCMVLSTLLLCACPAPDNGGTTTTTNNGGSQTPSEWKDTLDTAALKADFAGQTLKISAFEDFDYEIYAEEDSKNALDQLIYKRNKKIEERFAITIEPLITKATGISDQLSHYDYASKELQSLDPEFHLLMMMAFQSGKFIASGYYHDWRSKVPYAKDDLLTGSAWWPTEMNTSTTIKGRQFVAFSDMCITTIDLAYGMLFNQDLMTDENVMQDYNLKEGTSYATIYDMVDAGAWTLDALKAITKDFWIDDDKNLAGAGKVDLSDTIGFYGDRGNGLDSFAFSLGFSYINNDGVSEPTVWSMPTTFDTAVSELIDLFYNTNGATLAGMGKTNFEIADADGAAFFAEGHALFKNASLAEVMSATIKGMEDDYGVVPYPKLNTDQANYLTGISDNVSVLSIPKFITGKRLRLTGAVTVALSAETNKSINDTYFEMIVKHDSGFVDKRSVDMIDKIVAGRVYDLSIYHLQEFRWSDEDCASFGIFIRYLLWNKAEASGVWSGVQDSATLALSNLIKTYSNQR